MQVDCYIIGRAIGTRYDEEKPERDPCGLPDGALVYEDVEQLTHGLLCTLSFTPDFMPGFCNSNVSYGGIAFYQRNASEGYAHIRDHEPYVDPVTGIDEGYNHQAMLVGDKIPSTIAKGTWYQQNGLVKGPDGKTIGTRNSYICVLGDNVVVLGEDGDGLKIVTAYESASKVKEIRAKNLRRVLNYSDVREVYLDEQGDVSPNGPKAITATSCLSTRVGIHDIGPTWSRTR